MHRDIFGQSIHQIETIYHTAHKDTLLNRVRETHTHRYHTYIDSDQQRSHTEVHTLRHLHNTYT